MTKHKYRCTTHTWIAAQAIARAHPLHHTPRLDHTEASSRRRRRVDLRCPLRHWRHRLLEHPTPYGYRTSQGRLHRSQYTDERQSPDYLIRCRLQECPSLSKQLVPVRQSAFVSLLVEGTVQPLPVAPVLPRHVPVPAEQSLCIVHDEPEAQSSHTLLSSSVMFHVPMKFAASLLPHARMIPKNSRSAVSWHPHSAY